MKPPVMTDENKQLFRSALGKFATGVTVITFRNGPHEHGLTANSFTSVSLEPPLVLFCVAKNANSHDLLLECPGCVVNILSNNQIELSRLFAKKEKDTSSIEYERTELGFRFPSNLATLDCRLVDTYPGGDHTIFIGEVVSMNVHDGEPLLFYDGHYL